jgi:hypothetical protein
VVLAALGLYGLNTTMVSCPVNGCPSAELWNIYGPYEIMMWSGLALVVSGAVMVLSSYLLPREVKAVTI